MAHSKKTFLKLLSASADANISQRDLVSLLLALGFDERQGRGSHVVFSRDGVEEIITLSAHGNQAKPYQVKQVRRLIQTYDLKL